MRASAVDVLAAIPLSFPTDATVLGRAATDAARQLDAPGVRDVAAFAPAPGRGREWRQA